MTDRNIVNLNKARKQRDRAQRKQAADENSVLHGLTKPEKKRVKLDRIRAEHLLDGLKKDSDRTDP